MVSQVLRKANIQGDIWPGLPKRFQSFLFFRIQKPDEFKQRLRQFVPQITTAERACEMKNIIKAEKDAARREGRPAHLQPLPGVNISFSSTGLAKLGKFTRAQDEGEVKKDRNLSKIFKALQLRGGLFEKGMYADLVGEGWDNPEELRTEYKPVGGAKERYIDGVISVTSSLEDDFNKQVELVKKHFAYAAQNGVIDLPLIREGRTRLGDAKGKEHFGFEDGISQPLIKGLDEDIPVEKEPKAVEPGLIFSGHTGDDMKQPKWAQDGSFMVLRDLQQLVPEFDKFLEDNANKLPFAHDHHDPKEKLAAFLMGRWKNGTPVDLSPHDDKDETLFRSNNFDFHPVDKHDKCPFAAHIRKMRPRGDLDHDHAVIIRRGISYGGEVTPEEKAAKKSSEEHERGLLFVCYQSDLRNGFNFLTTRWASNHHFPDRKSKFVGDHGPGIDAIVGQRLPHHPPRSIGLPDGKDPTEARMDLDSWVIHKGGEYFFTPSIESLRDHLTGPDDFTLPTPRESKL